MDELQLLIIIIYNTDFDGRTDEHGAPVSRRDRATPHNLRNLPHSNRDIFARFQLLFAPEVRQISGVARSLLRHLWCLFRLFFTVFRSFSFLVRSARTVGTKVKVKYTDIAVRSLTCHTATGTHTPYRTTQCYLPPDRKWEVTFPPLPQTKLVLDKATPEGCKAEDDLVGWLHTEMVYPPEDGHPSHY